MPPKFAALSNMTTRAKNKDAHPGVPDMPTPRRTHQEVEESREKAAAIEAAELKQREKAIDNVAAIEDKQRKEDKARQQREDEARRQARKARDSSKHDEQLYATEILT